MDICNYKTTCFKIFRSFILNTSSYQLFIGSIFATIFALQNPDQLSAIILATGITGILTLTLLFYVPLITITTGSLILIFLNKIINYTLHSENVTSINSASECGFSTSGSSFEYLGINELLLLIIFDIECILLFVFSMSLTISSTLLLLFILFAVLELMLTI